MPLSCYCHMINIIVVSIYFCIIQLLMSSSLFYFTHFKNFLTCEIKYVNPLCSEWSHWSGSVLFIKDPCLSCIIEHLLQVWLQPLATITRPLCLMAACSYLVGWIFNPFVLLFFSLNWTWLCPLRSLTYAGFYSLSPS